MITAIAKFIWDLTYACPLRCGHCYSESGRRAARMLSRKDALRVVDVIIEARPKRISLSGGEPLLVEWWDEAVRRLSRAGISVTVFTSGWMMDEQAADELARSVTSVAVSLDGYSEPVHDAVRGRRGAFDRAMATLGLLERVKRERAASDNGCYLFGVDYTVTRTGQGDLAGFVRDMTSRFPELDFVRFGAVVPGGPAAEEDFVSRELLSDEELAALADSESRLASSARSDAEVSVTDVRYFLPNSPLSSASAEIAHVEADGQLRAFTTYEAKVGNILEEPLDVLWNRALAWRTEPFVVEQLGSIRTLTDWARVTRTLDHRYGSADDRARIERRR